METKHSHLESLSESDCLQILKSSTFGHLGFHQHGQMVILPFNFAFDDGYIYSHSLPGSKLDAMKKNPEVCLQTESVENMIKWKSVLAWGRFEDCPEEDANRIMRDLIKNMNLTQQQLGRSSLELDFSALLERATVYRIKINKVIGRSEGWRV